MNILQHTTEKRGFVSLFTVLMATVILSITIGMSSVALKQVVLGSTASEANDAFYAADAGMQCAIMNDRNGEFEVGADLLIGCGSGDLSQIPIQTGDNQLYTVVGDTGSGFDWNNNTCVFITVRKDSDVTEIEAFGYNVPCDDIVDNPRAVERALRVRYAG